MVKRIIYNFPYLTMINGGEWPVELRPDHPYRCVEGFYEFKRSELENYANYPRNEHHYTTATTWNVIFPKFMKDFGIDYNVDDYIYVYYTSEGADLSYHDYNKEMDVKVVSGGEVFDHLRDLNGTRLTAYHRLFIAPHKGSIVINNTAKTNRILKLNCDSMTIPLIPLITPYFKKIYVNDYRYEYVKYYDFFKDADYITDECYAYLTCNFIRIFGR